MSEKNHYMWNKGCNFANKNTLYIEYGHFKQVIWQQEEIRS